MNFSPTTFAGEKFAIVGLGRWGKNFVESIQGKSQRLRIIRGAGFPLLFVYNDGDPLDESRLAGFAWRLRGREARRLDAGV